MTPPRRRAATGLPDATVERIVVGVVALRGRLDLDAAIVAILHARRARDTGDTGWPETLEDLEDVLPPRGCHLRALPALAAATACCPSGAA